MRSLQTGFLRHLGHRAGFMSQVEF
jgi:hypothetical protein